MEKPSENVTVCYLFSLPVEIISKIISFETYEQIGKMRSVCKLFNEICSTTLNSTFSRLQSLLLSRYHQIKSQMPRRESSRRSHPLAREWDIVETVHMRLTLLEMTFGKHIERKNCCFFAGEILDEVFRIYRYVSSSSNLGRAYRVTDELFELTTMATEYFRECIEPSLPDIIYFSSDLLDYTSSGLNACNWKSQCNSSNNRSFSDCWINSTEDKQSVNPSPNGALKKRIKRLRQGMKRNNNRLAFLKRELKSSASQMGDHQRQLIEYSARLEDYDKKFEENARKLSCIFQELNKCKTELQYWRSKSPANQLCCNCSSTISTQIQGNSVGETSGAEMHNNEDDFSRYFIMESKQESPKNNNRVNELAQFHPIHLEDVDEAAVDGVAGNSANKMKKRKIEEKCNVDDGVQPTTKLPKKALVKRLL